MSELFDQDDLFQTARRYFDLFVTELQRYGIEVDPAMEFRPGTGMWCYYDLSDGNIYFSVPDLNDAIGKFQMLMLRALFSCETNAEFFKLGRLLIPQAVAHEIGHHLRHRYGRFTDDAWHEEQVANRLGIAMVRQRLNNAQRQEMLPLLQRAIQGLVVQLNIESSANNAYEDIWQAMATDGQFSATTYRRMQLTHQLFAVEPQQMLTSSGQFTDSVNQRLSQRELLIDEMNTHYAADFQRYLYFQLSWLYLDLTSSENEYIDAFAREHLGLTPPLLACLPQTAVPCPQHVLACFKAFQDCEPLSAAASDYFYKRYRELLLELVQTAESQLPGHTSQLHREAGLILQSGYSQDEQADMLRYLTHLAAPQLQALFPAQIIEHPDLATAVPTHLPTETDKRLWFHVVQNAVDAAAATTLERLATLHGLDLFDDLPAGALLSLTHTLNVVYFQPGETMIWEGDSNHDAYILTAGLLDVVKLGNGRSCQIGVIQAGELFGEMAYFTHEPRQATVRARESAECLALRGVDLHALALQYPVVSLDIARVLAKRLAAVNAKVINNGA